VRLAEAPAPYAAPPRGEFGDRQDVLSVPEFRAAQPETLNPEPETGRAAPFRVLGQAAGAYIVIEDETGLKVLDQHAVHERVLFEELAAQGRSGRPGDAQGLLVPETVELTPAQAAAFADPHTRAALEELGYDLAEFGPRAQLVQAVPAVLKTPRAAALVAEILDGLADGASDPGNSGTDRTSGLSPNFPALRAKAAELAACKGAVKAGERLSLAQMEGLVAEFLARVSPSGGTCPHGRPLAVELTWDELERRVGRA
jgi:DNA mismatch repair protein MutL